MNFLRYHSKISRVTYGGLRKFSTAGKSSPTLTKDLTKSKALNDNQSKSRTSTKNKTNETQENLNHDIQSDPQYSTSTGSRFVALNTAGPVSEVNSSGVTSNNDFISPSRQFVDAKVTTPKGSYERATRLRKEFIHNATFSTTARGTAESATQATQQLANTVVDIGGSVGKASADAIDSATRSLNSNISRSGSKDNYRSPYRQRADRYASGSKTNVIDSPLRDIGNLANTVALSFVPTFMMRDVYSVKPENNYSDRNRYRDDIKTKNRPSEIVSDTIRGVADLAGSLAATFIPGAQTPNYKSPFGINTARNIVNTTLQGLNTATKGVTDIAGTIASNIIPGAQEFISGSKPINKKSSASLNKDFIYIGSEVEDLTFTDANKKGQVSSGSTAEEVLDIIKNVANTATAAAQDAVDMASSATRKIAKGASKGAYSSANTFVTTAGSTALSAAASAARRFNAAASAIDTGNDEAQQGFIYTGTQVKEDFTFKPAENQSIEADDKKNIYIKRPSVPSYDVVISGAGVSGSALACALGHYRYFNKENKKILLLDPKESRPIEDFQNGDNTPDHKVVVLSLSSVSFLKEIGVWSLLNRDRIGTINQMQVWETGGNSFVKFNEDPSHEMGYAVEKAHLQAALLERIRTLENIQVDTPNKITDIRNDTRNSATVILDDEAKIYTKLVVGSDSPNSLVGSKSKIASTGWNPNQHGIFCTVKTHYHNSTAWQRFLSTGSLAILPLWDEYSSIIWSCESKMHQALLQASDQDFLRELNYNLTRKSDVNTPNIVFSQNSGFDLPPSIIELCNKRKSFPISMQQANQYVAQRAALIGDAAHTIHPLAGQALNMGLNDASYLANVIIKNLRAGNDIGNVDLLREYETASMNLNTAMLYSMEFVKRFYESNNYSPFVFARNFAISAVNNSSPFKSLFIKIANGKYFQPLDYEWKTVG